ncbi:hypothetical protein [Bacillus thuringiensis]|uniref:hypothetical protein n=1 Tax=Bacillus thuringiensis TaxID=1428 RepID=UPI0021D684BE|nr:hypothetical protein [Bacillus thuringiensis]MCU7667325.1 hypothetical protein [Bacillus thuringiensis]
MKRNLLIFFILTIITLVGCNKTEPTPHKENIPLTSESTIRGLKVGAMVNKSVYKVGEPIEVKAYIQNTKGEIHKFEGTPCDGKLYISIADKYSKYRLQGKGDIVPDVCIEPMGHHELKPQQILNAKATFNTNKVIKLDEGTEEKLKPGKYFIEVKYYIDTVVAAEIEIK